MLVKGPQISANISKNYDTYIKPQIYYIYNFVVIIVFVHGLAPIFPSCITMGLTLECYHMTDIISFTTGTEVAAFVNKPGASSMAHGINAKFILGITGSTIYASLSSLDVI